MQTADVNFLNNVDPYKEKEMKFTLKFRENENDTFKALTYFHLSSLKKNSTIGLNNGFIVLLTKEDKSNKDETI